MINRDFVGPIGNASPKYETANPIQRLLLGRFLRAVDAEAADAAPARVLDVGCGEGIVAERFARLLSEATILGVDADDVRLRIAWERRGLGNLSFATASAYDLPFGEASFDLVCAFEVLEHLERPRDALAEMARVSRQSLLVSVPREPHWQLSHLVAGRNLRRFGDTPGHINHWSRAAFASLISDYGQVTRVRSSFPWTLAAVDVRAQTRRGEDDSRRRRPLEQGRRGRAKRPRRLDVDG
jgi:SAM-dependent methyltransferase